jgi:hypothetical protein
LSDTLKPHVAIRPTCGHKPICGRMLQAAGDQFVHQQTQRDCRFQADFNRPDAVDSRHQRRAVSERLVLLPDKLQRLS